MWPRCDAVCLFLGWHSVASLATHKQIGPFWCWFSGHWVCVHSRTLWVSPTNSPLRLGVSPAATILSGFYSQMFWSFISPLWNPGLCCLSHSSIVPPGLSVCKYGTTQYDSHCLYGPRSSRSWLPVFAPPTSLNECFFFNSFVVRLPYSSIFWQRSYFLFLNLLFSFFWLCEEAKYIYLCLHLGQKSVFWFYFKFLVLLHCD